MRLTIELVPSTCWYTNVRSNVTTKEWDIIRKKCYANANNVCEICGDVGTKQGYKHNLECHEIWEYDEQNKIQKLIGLIALCPNCHTTKHPGLAQMKNRMHIVEKQLQKINNMSYAEVQIYLTSAFKLWEERSKYNWTLNIDCIAEYMGDNLIQ